MSLNIKNPRVHLLAREAARRTGTTQTSVIEHALERYLSFLDDEHNPDSRIDQLLEQMQDRVAHSGGVLGAENLYDEDGLPA